MHRINLAIALLVGLLSSYLYISQNHFFESLNAKILDSFFVFRGEIKPNNNVVIVDIDEKSLKELGQWPWSRDKVAKILKNLTNANVGVIGLDIVFAEVDSSSPKRVLKKLGLEYTKAPDFDDILAKTMKNSPVVAGYVFDFKDKFIKGVVPNISTIIIEKNKKKKNFLPRAKGVITNIPLLQKSSYSSGFFNTIPDSDGIVRSVPLLARFQDSIYPSLSLEILRLAYGANRIILNYTKTGVETINLDKKTVKTDRFARAVLNYYGKSKLFRYISAVDIYKNEFKKEEIEGKIVLIGTSAAGLLDLRATPMDSTYAGVEIHATAIENILDGTYLRYPQFGELIDLLDIFILLFLIAAFFRFFRAFKAAILSIALVGSFISFCYYEFAYNMTIIDIIYPLLSSLVLYMILASLHYFLESRQKEMIEKSFSKKVSPSVAKTLIDQNGKDLLEPKEREVTLFFSDIRGFTSISEKLASPKKVIEFLNLYMTPMTEIITKNRGTLDKFIGDAIMAYWNAPLKEDNHADCAVQSAIEQIKELEKLNKKLQIEDLPCIDIGIGINSGIVVVGEMGSVGRSDYTIIGDHVNLGSRLEGLNKIYGSNIIISQFTKNLLRKKYDLRELDKVRVKGKDNSVLIYEVMVDGEENIMNLKKYNEAIAFYKGSSFHKALVLFEELLEEKPLSKLYKLYVKRCKLYAKNPPINFDGVFVLTTK